MGRGCFVLAALLAILIVIIVVVLNKKDSNPEKFWTLHTQAEPIRRYHAADVRNFDYAPWAETYHPPVRCGTAGFNDWPLDGSAINDYSGAGQNEGIPWGPSKSHFAGGRGGVYIPLYSTGVDTDFLAGQCMLPGECRWAT